MIMEQWIFQEEKNKSFDWYRKVIKVNGEDLTNSIDSKE